MLAVLEIMSASLDVEVEGGGDLLTMVPWDWTELEQTMNRESEFPETNGNPGASISTITCFTLRQASEEGITLTTN